MDRQSRLVRVGRAAARPFVSWARHRPVTFTFDFALARPLLARKKRKQQELALPLVASGDPALAERLGEHLDGFGER